MSHTLLITINSHFTDDRLWVDIYEPRTEVCWLKLHCILAPYLSITMAGRACRSQEESRRCSSVVYWGLRWRSIGEAKEISGKLIPQGYTIVSDDQAHIQRILALTGPAGTAKTATVRILSRELGFEILEWRNSMSENFSKDDHIGMQHFTSDIRADDK